MSLAPPPQPAPTPETSGLLHAPGLIWWLPLLLAAVAGAAVFFITDGDGQVYESHAALLVPEGDPAAPAAFAAQLTSDDVLNSTIRTLQLDTTAALVRQRIAVEVNGVVVGIFARASSPEAARRLAQAVINEARDPRNASPSDARPRLHRRAARPDQPVQDERARNSAVAVAAGLLAGIGLAVVVGRPERAQAHRLDAHRLTPWPVLGRIPRRPTSPDPRGSAGEPAQAYGRLWARIEAERGGAGFRRLLVTGVERGDGASTVAVQLALAAAAAGLRTTLVDADLFAPALHQRFGLPNGPGLADSLATAPAALGLRDPEPALPLLILTRPSDASNSDRLRLLTAGFAPTDPEALLRGASAPAVFDRLAADADLVIIDGPALQSRAALAALAHHADALLIVVNALSGDPEAVQHAAEGLGRSAGRVIGVVVTRDAAAPPPAAPAPALGWPGALAAPRRITRPDP